MLMSFIFLVLSRGIQKQLPVLVYLDTLLYRLDAIFKKQHTLVLLFVWLHLYLRSQNLYF